MKSIVAIFAICAIVSTAVGVAGLMSLGPYSVFGEELTYESESKSIDDHNLAGFGAFPSAPDSDDDEVLDSDVYTMSFTDKGVGQKIVVQAEIEQTTTWAIIGGEDWSVIRYCFDIKTAGDIPLTNDGYQVARGWGADGRDKKWIDAGEKTTKGQWYSIYLFGAMENVDAIGCITLTEDRGGTTIGVHGVRTPVRIMNIHGAAIPHGSILRVRVQHYGRDNVFDSENWATLGKDEALLRTGMGYISLDQESGYEIGETALVTVVIPYVSTASGSSDGDGGYGFYFSAWHGDTGKALKKKDGTSLTKITLTSTTTVFKILVLDEHFSKDPVNDNLLHFELYNELYPKDAADRVVVDVKEKAPPPPLVSTDKEEYFQGETINIEWSCSPNPSTNASIVRAVVIAYLSGVEIHRETYPGNAGIASFIAPMSGILRYNVICYDSENRGSGNEERLVIHNVQQNDFCSINPTHPLCTGDEDVFPLWEVLILTLAIVGAFFVVAIMAYGMNSFGIPPLYTLTIAAVLFLIFMLAIVVVGQGAIDAIASYQAVIR